jgi:hypothetical protein
MARSIHPDPLAEAIAELAQHHANLRTWTPVQPKDAEVYARDVDVLVAYWAQRRADLTADRARGEILESLTEEQSARFDAAACADHPLAATIYREAMIGYVAHYIAQEARDRQAVADDEEVDSDDPFTADPPPYIPPTRSDR